jgi:hypothetical protein
VRLPPRSPNLNAHAERFVRSVKEECLDHLILSSEEQLRYVLGEAGRSNWSDLPINCLHPPLKWPVCRVVPGYPFPLGDLLDVPDTFNSLVSCGYSEEHLRSSSQAQSKPLLEDPSLQYDQLSVCSPG